LRNAVAVFDHANQLGNALRRNQDRQDDFVRNVDAQERDYKNRLIELFGTPFLGDIGPGGTYPQGYDGPDLYHYMYVDTVDLTGDATPPAQVFSGFYSSQLYGNSTFSHFFPRTCPAVLSAFNPRASRFDIPMPPAIMSLFLRGPGEPAMLPGKSRSPSRLSCRKRPPCVDP
jgi:hypothetical protein